MVVIIVSFLHCIAILKSVLLHCYSSCCIVFIQVIVALLLLYWYCEFTAWVQFLPAPTHETCLCCSAKSSLMMLACLNLQYCSYCFNIVSPDVLR